MNGGCSHVDTFDPKPSLTKFAGKPIPITLKTERRTGAAFPSPFHVQEVRPERHRSQRDLLERRRLCRRSVHRALDAHRYPESRAVADDDELRRRAAGSAELRLVGDVWAGLGESESARLHCAVSRRSADAGKSELAIGVSARSVSGDTHRHAGDADRQADREYPEQLHHGAEQREQLDLLSELNRGYQERRQNDALLEARVQSFELAYRMQMEADDAFDLSKEPEHIHKMYGEGCRRGR